MAREFPWSDDPEDKTVVSVKAPASPPPHCGGVENVQNLGDIDKIMRSCCRCHKKWLCTRDEWMNGTCPNCGASGYNGKGGKVFDEPTYYPSLSIPKK